MSPRFQDLASFTTADIEAAFDRNDPAELALVSLTVSLSSGDPVLASSVCVRLSRLGQEAVRGNALLGLGHLARRFRSLDEPSVRPVIEAGLADPSAAVRSSAASAADEIHQFLGWTFPGHHYGS